MNKKKITSGPCGECAFYAWDDECECYTCQKDLDEDEMLRFLSGSDVLCPYFQNGDEYATVRKQN